MRPIDQSLSDADLQQRRVAIRRDLVRGNTTAIVLLIALVGLALLAALKASQADAARGEATAKLWDSYRAQARAARLSGEAGRRTEAVAAIRAASKIRASEDLKEEAIAALGLTDIESTTNFVSFTAEPFGVSFNADFSLYALRTAQKVEIRATDQQRTLMSISAASLPDAARFTDDGKYVALGFRNGLIEIRELATTNVVWSQTAEPGWASSFDLSRDSERLVYRPSPTNIGVVHFQSNKELFSIGAAADQPTVLFSPDGKLLSVNNGKRITIWSLGNSNAKKLKDFDSPSTMLSIAWHHDSSEIAAGCEDHVIRIWDIPTGRLGTIDGHTREIISLAYSPTSDLLVSYAWDGTTRLWNSRTGDQLLRSQKGWARAFSRDGKKLSYVKPNKGFGYWNVVESDSFSILGQPLRAGSWMRWVDFSPDGKLLAVGYYSEVQIWDVTTHRLLAEIPGRDIKTTAFAQSGETLIISDATGAREWRLRQKGAKMEAAEVEPPLFDKWTEKTVVLSADRRTAAVSGGHDHNLAVVDMFTRKIKEIGIHQNSANVAISGDGRDLAVGTWKGSGTRVWRIGDDQGATVLDPRDAFVAFDPKGKWLLAGHGDEYSFWDTATWSNSWSLKRDVPTHATGPMGFSRNGEILAVSLTGWSLDLVDTERRKVAAQLTSPILKPVGVIAVSDDGTKIAASMTDGSVQVWDLPKLRDGLAGFGLGLLEKNDVPSPIQTRGIFSSTVVTAIILLALVSALFVGITGLQRHRRLVEEYSAIEKLVMDRNAQLESYRTELAHSQKMRALGTLAAGIAHDFNNLLSVIRMANKLTAKEGRANSDIAANVAVVEQAVEQGKQVVKSMLGYSRASEANVGAYSVAELAENVVPLLSRQFLAGITLTLELDYTTAGVTRARNRLQQVLLNLIVNASEAMAGQGKLTIAVKAERELNRQFVRKPSPSSEYVRLSVGDSGPGIPSEVLPRIFEPFFTTKNMGADPGTGLGLSVVYTVAEEEGLGLAVDTQPGEGATFHIYIPVSAETEIKEAAERRPDTQMSPVGRV